MEQYTNLKLAMELIAKSAVDEYKKIIKSKAYASGKLYNSINYELVVTSTGVSIKFIALDYYLEIENGRAKGKMPPISAIKKWMVYKGIPNKPGMAYRIARSIGKDGIKPRPFLKNISDKLTNKYNKQLEEALAKDVTKTVNKELNNLEKISKNANTKQ